MTKEVKIACEGHNTVPLDKLIVIQGGLKTLSDINAGKLQKSILKHGFSAPIFVWPHKTKVKTTLKVIDGTQRTAERSQGEDPTYPEPVWGVFYHDIERFS